jgi:hypothetical protein
MQEASPRLHALHRTIARPATCRKVVWCTQKIHPAVEKLQRVKSQLYHPCRLRSRKSFVAASRTTTLDLCSHVFCAVCQPETSPYVPLSWLCANKMTTRYFSRVPAGVRRHSTSNGSIASGRSFSLICKYAEWRYGAI